MCGRDAPEAPCKAAWRRQGGVSVFRAANSGVALMEAHHLHGTAYVGARRPGAALLKHRVRK